MRNGRLGCTRNPSAGNKEQLKLKFEQLKECDVAHLVRILDAKIPDFSVRTLTGMRASTAEPVTEDFLSYGDACIVLAQVRSRALKGSISPADLKETLLGKTVVRYTTLTEMPVRISAKETVQLLCDIWRAQVPEVPGSEPSASFSPAPEKLDSEPSSSSAPEMPGSERLASFSSIPERQAVSANIQERLTLMSFSGRHLGKNQ